MVADLSGVLSLVGQYFDGTRGTLGAVLGALLTATMIWLGRVVSRANTLTSAGIVAAEKAAVLMFDELLIRSTAMRDG